MNLRIVKSEAEFLQLKEAWDALDPAPMQSFAWNFAWWQSFSRYNALRIYCYEDQGTVVGIAPFYFDRRLGQRALKFLGSGITCSDYAQLIVADEHRQDFLSEIAEDVRQSRFIRMVELDGVLADPSQNPDLKIVDQLGTPFWRYDRDVDSSWILELPDSWDQFLKQSASNLRRKVRKAARRIDGGEVQIRSTRDDLPVESAFATLVRLHLERTDAKGLQSAFCDPEYVRFLHAAAADLIPQGKAEILTAEHQGKPIAVHFNLQGPRGPQLYQSGASRDAMELEPGYLLFTHVIRRTIGEGIAEFDFLRGDEPYKKFWGARPVPLATVRCVSKSLFTTAGHKLALGARRLKNDLRSFQWRGLGVAR
ncbi:GNAT family N-acetyltransferase [Rosistilla oblonga]|uniref:GNAT family N-acetyltransferase n=1 Tax=Rosistilla oblonga TaxID=2527990 RepID=UPI003A985883